MRSIGYQWSAIWGGPSKSAPPSGAKAGQVVLTADHPTLTTDVDDISFVKAEVSGTSAVTFAITGPGTIVAVDSGSMTQESFRGNTRNAFGGVAYALVQATGAGAHNGDGNLVGAHGPAPATNHGHRRYVRSLLRDV